MVRVILSLLVISFIACQKEPEIDFYKENVVIEIENNRAQVTGTYFFRNSTLNRKRIVFYYPFPVDSLHLYPDSILLDSPYKADSTGIYFTKVLHPNKNDSFKIVYQQKMVKNKFCYITTTTEFWQRPIKEAKFTIVMPESLLVEINYPIYERKHKDRKIYYIIQIKKFYPTEDLIIEW